MAGPPRADLDRLAELAAAEALEVFGAFNPPDRTALPPDTRALVLLGPHEPGFWAHVRCQPEFADGRPDPLDRWSARVIGAIAAHVGGSAVFPFGGPPWAPFHEWAVASGRAWPSPVGLLVHDRAGLMVSFRGAIALAGTVADPPPQASPCAACADRPCLTACPAGALGGAGYDLAACHAFLDSDAGAGCMGAGCQVRRICPVSAGYARQAEQSAFHMKAFHR